MMSIDISNTLKLLYFVKKISEHQYDMRILESCVDLNPLMVERQDPYNFTRFQTREKCALEIAAYVFNWIFTVSFITINMRGVEKRVSTALLAIQIDTA